MIRTQNAIVIRVVHDAFPLLSLFNSRILCPVLIFDGDGLASYAGHQ